MDILNINLLESPDFHQNTSQPEMIHKLNIIKASHSIEEIVKQQYLDDYCQSIIEVKTSSGFFLINHFLHKLMNDTLEIKATL